MRGKIRSIQVLRAVAACAVVALHAAVNADAESAAFARVGAAGVDLFFVISGFIMAQVAQGRTPAVFLRERAWRIFPLWWLAVLPWLLLAPPNLRVLSASLTLWPIYGNAFYFPALVVGWTLSFELLFYVGMALKLRAGAVVPLALYGAFAVLGIATDQYLFHYLGSPMVLEFMFGLAIARLPLDRRIGVPLILLAFGMFAVSPFTFEIREVALSAGYGALRVLFWGFPCGLLVYGALCLEDAFKAKSFDALVFLGNASFSIYVFHMLVMRALPFNGPLAFVIAVGVGALIYATIEKPLQAARSARKVRLGTAALVSK